jgi:hypothetical protein
MELKERADKAGFSLELYLQGMSLLHRSGVLGILRENGRVFPVSPDSENYLAYQSAVANWSVGFHSALDQLMNFGEALTYVEKETPLADFGGISRAVNQGNLTKEEADAVRANAKYSGLDK